MNKFLIFLFLLFNLFGFSQPISESNYFVYDKLHYGVSLHNVNNQVHQNKDGEIIVSEYSGHIYKVNNILIQKGITDIEGKNQLLQTYFKLKDGSEYYCGNHEITIAKKGKTIKIIKLNSQSDFSHSFGILNNEIYFTTYYKSGVFLLRKFDGISIQNLIRLRSNPYNYTNQLFINHQVNVIEIDNKFLKIFKFENNKLIPIKKYQINDETFIINYFINENNFSGYTIKKKLFYCDNGNINFYGDDFNFPFLSTSYNSKYYFRSFPTNKEFFEFSNDGLKFLFNTSFNSTYFFTKKNKESNSFYIGTNTQFLRFFPHVKKYPRIFNNSNSSSIFTLLQTSDGTIWAGSYQGFLSSISNNEVKQSSVKEFMFLNGGLSHQNKILVFGEANKGLLLFNNLNDYQKIVDSTTFFYAYKSKNNQLYLGTYARGLWKTDFSNLEKKDKIEWNIINEKNGLNLYNVITICEDKFGNIWTGRGKQGIAVYNPKTNKAKTWLIENNEIDFGSICSVLDNKNTLWFGKSDGGLCYYDGKNENDYDVKNFKLINHPLLKNDIGISFIKQWRDYLILGAKDKILLFNLEEWYKNKKVFIRYLNAQETNFSTPTEQNTCLVDNHDESIWFATGDMLYQFDIKKWINLPCFKVIPKVIIKKENEDSEFAQNKSIFLEPTENSFDIQVIYQSKDNLPRYINGALVKKDIIPIFENPNLSTTFNFKNLTAGEYIFYLRVCQQDGSYNIYEYPIFIDNFIWQKWWFWILISLIPIGFIVFYFKNKNEIEQTKKKLSQLNLASLSNQFRPHFMLNALNSIGSQMENMPHAEKVISRLGESINILYGFTQSNDFVHSFKNEWKLVENIIEIQKLLFIPNLKVIIEGIEKINDKIKVPVGLIQIPIENALLHGLRNKVSGDFNLDININEVKDFYIITIKDNGIGRKKASEINNFKKNGNGLKTIYEMITIINQFDTNAIQFNIEDYDNEEGTMVTIKFKKEIDYAKIKF